MGQAEVDREIREACEPHFQELAVMFADEFNPVIQGGDAGLLRYAIDKLEHSRMAIRDAARLIESEIAICDMVEARGTAESLRSIRESLLSTLPEEPADKN